MHPSSGQENSSSCFANPNYHKNTHSQGSRTMVVLVRMLRRLCPVPGRLCAVLGRLLAKLLPYCDEEGQRKFWACDVIH